MRKLALLLSLLISVPAAAATFTVVNTSDGGPGSLRQAIVDANASAGYDLIEFAIPGAGVHTITPTSALPPLTETATIDGYTQPGASPNTQLTSDDAVLRIELNGAASGPATVGVAVSQDVADVTVRGLVVNRFGTANISVTGGNLRVEGCFIGTDPSGTIMRSRDSAAGVTVGAAAAFVTVGGIAPAQRNIISGNSASGVDQHGGTLVLQGNFIGVDATGASALPNSSSNVRLLAGTATVGGLAATSGTPPGNVISGSLGAGVEIGTSAVTVQGNLIGTNSAGTEGLPNLGHGIVIPQGAGISSTIGGAAAGAANVIAFNGGDGIWASSTGGTAVIRSNQIDANTGLGIRGRSDYPRIISAVSSGGTTRISGWVNSRIPFTWRDVELFAVASCDASGYGEGATPISWNHVRVDDSRIGLFAVALPYELAPGTFVTGTATVGYRFEAGTSRFSACRIVTGSSVTPTPSPTPTMTPTGPTLTPTLTPTPSRTPTPTPTPTPPLQVLAIAPGSGTAAGGTSVTVAGTGFLPGVSLTIGGVLVENVVVVGSTELAATTPELPPGSLNTVAVSETVSRPRRARSASAILPAGWMANFLDVPQDDIFHSDVEMIFRYGITAGCGGGNYCRNESVRREQMAVFLLKARYGSAYLPPPCVPPGSFEDVPCPGPFTDWIEAFLTEGLTAGCAAGLYCPTHPVRRDQMAVFLLRARHGATYGPPACLPPGTFGDVPCPNPDPEAPDFVDWIEQLLAQGITAGCGGGNYCPDRSITRGEMAVFLVKTFQLQ